MDGLAATIVLATIWGLGPILMAYGAARTYAGLPPMERLAATILAVIGYLGLVLMVYGFLPGGEMPVSVPLGLFVSVAAFGVLVIAGAIRTRQ
jgi:hypothetical protein